MKALSLLLLPICGLWVGTALGMKAMDDQALASVAAQDGVDMSSTFQSTSVGVIALGTSNGLDSSSTSAALTQWLGLSAQGAADIQIGLGANSTEQASALVNLSGTFNFSSVTVYTSPWDGTPTSLMQTAVASGASTEFTYNLGQVVLSQSYLINPGFTDQTNGQNLSSSGLTITNKGCTNVCTQLNNPSWTEGSSNFAATSVAYQGMSPVSVSITAASTSTLTAWKTADTGLSTSLASNTASNGLLISIGAISGSRVVTGATGTGTTGNYTQTLNSPATTLLIPSNANAQQILRSMAQLSNALGVPSLLGPGSLFK